MNVDCVFHCMPVTRQEKSDNGEHLAIYGVWLWLWLAAEAMAEQDLPPSKECDQGRL